MVDKLLGLGAGDVFASQDVAMLLKGLPDGKVELQISSFDADGRSTMKHQGLLPVVSTAPRYIVVPE
jgi:hypothetical protein